MTHFFTGYVTGLIHPHGLGSHRNLHRIKNYKTAFFLPQQRTSASAAVTVILRDITIAWEQNLNCTGRCTVGLATLVDPRHKKFNLCFPIHTWVHCFPMLLFNYVFDFNKYIIIQTESAHLKNQILANLLV